MTSRDWVYVVIILLIAASLRFIGLSFGKVSTVNSDAISFLHPQAAIHPDEYFYVATPLEMVVRGRFNPGFFENPSLLINLQAVIFALTGSQLGIQPHDLDALYPRSFAPFPLYVMARALSALGGVLAVVATFTAARLLAGRTAAIAGGLLVAVSFPLVQHGHYATTNSLAAGFVSVSVLASLLALRNPGRLLWWLVAGIAAGLAAGSRYNAAAVGLVPFTVGLVLLARRADVITLRNIALGWGAFPVTFVMTTPFVVLDFPTFREQFTFIFGRFSGGVGVEFPAEDGLYWTYRYLIVFGLGPMMTTGIVFSLWRVVRRASARQVSMAELRILVLLPFLIAYSFVVLNTRVPAISDQLTLIVIPALAVMGGAGLAWLRRGWPVVLRWIIIFAVALPPSILSLTFVQQLVQPDTRDIALEWIETHIPEGTYIHLLGPYNVPLNPQLYQIQQSFGSDLPDINTLLNDGVALVVLSDAWFFQQARMAGIVPPEYLDALRAYRNAYDERFPRLFEVPRPVWPGYDWLMNNAAYWHSPAIFVYCLNDAACAAVH